MPNKARRLLARALTGMIRRALLVLCVMHAGQGVANTIVDAWYESVTPRYPHGVLGDALEYETLVLTLGTGETVAVTLPDSAVFEDTAPRLVDLDNDGHPEVVTVESHQQFGARLAIYGASGRITAIPYIGTRFRWLAPVGAADLDGDGVIEIAYVDRPHLAKILRIWRFERGVLTEIATFEGVSNHKIGETDIAGGIRVCDTTPEMVLASENWRSLLALRFDGAEITARKIGTETSRASFARSMACQDPS
ncbi:MAG: VCBS repeat-containing protein [Roseobacter sp.]